MKTLHEMQNEVDTYIRQFKVGYFTPMENMVRLTEEVGELAREINHVYGPKQKKLTEQEKEIGMELADNLFVLISLANSMDIDLTEYFNMTMQKFNTRDHDRFERIEEE
ncbi:nucleotide pyrophosphohydrolase [Macrococcus armenti]|uniref:nucleotide pyrophosphohydrolase n=1 Tax=Macrococcus armenti TaxID=2875764 RepID=UPI001CCAA136|nr:nucleotide pyrophosphohydrolase [Macrococcus armenti]UBH07611.1 nucleotide pyrophosphohydrolase [Macrococcus armenti]UBH09844.1 nucleotide pyrophosphohydrolase [Macrococcus armenti]UBH12196.1 nucleotide pyrophosphohydrolase [Macrococcus armenti]UBH14387.1 nucleotide pyrophosphohydrolase [Macrococcus armenti]UBH16747.1 nucleotide pyrophosphohydrolase [Macrococcus armenti]